MKRFVLLFVALFTPFLAQSQYKPFFYLDARSKSLGGITSTLTHAPNSFVWNPANLTFSRQQVFGFSVDQVFSYDQAAVADYFPKLGGIGLVLGRLPGEVSTDYAGIGWGKSHFPGFSVGASSFVLKRSEETSLEWAVGVSYFPRHRFGQPLIQGLPIYWDRIGLSAALQNMVLGKTRLGLPLRFNLGTSYEVIPKIFTSFTEFQFSKDGNDFILAGELNNFFSTVLRSGIVNFRSGNWLAGFGIRLGSLQFDFVYERFEKKIQFSSTIKFGESPSIRAAKHYAAGRRLLEKKQVIRALPHFRDAAAFEPDNGKYRESFQLVKQRYGELRLKEQELMGNALENERRGEKLAAFLLFHDVLDQFPANELAARKVVLIRPTVYPDLDRVKSKIVELYGEEDFLTASKILNRVYHRFIGDTLLHAYKQQVDRKLRDLAEESFNRGLGYFSQKELYAAEREFIIVKLYNPSFSEIDLYLADVRGRIRARELEIDSLLVQARQRDESQQYRLAMQYYSTVLELDSKNVEAKKAIDQLKPRIASHISSLFGRAASAFTRLDYDRAESICNEILRLDPNDSKAQRLRSRSRSARSRSAALYAAQGDSASGLQDLENALKHYTKASELNPREEGYRTAIQRTENHILWEQKWQEALIALANDDFIRAEELAAQLISDQPGRQEVSDFIDRVKTTKDQRVTALLQEGIQLYSRQQYALAIGKFEEILKVDEKNQTASEYKKRSEDKKRALDSLRQ